MRNLRLAATLFLAAGLPALADNTGYIYYQTTTSGGFSMRVADSTDNYFVGAQSINTGSFDEITDVTVSLYVNGNFGAVNSWYLYTDNDGTPGTEVALLGTIQNSAITPGVNQFYDLGADDVLVTQDTTYFVVDQYDAAQSTGTQEIFWYGAGNGSNTVGLTGSVALTANDGGWMTRGNDYQQMTVSGISPAPEPGTFVIAGMCLIGLAVGGRYRRSRARL